MLDAKIVDLKMNVAKTQLNRKNKNNKAEQIQVKIDGTELKKQYSVRYLGVHIDKDLTWKVHVNHLRRTCLARLAMIIDGLDTTYLVTYVSCYTKALSYQTWITAL